MRQIFTWLRTIFALLIGIIAIMLFHKLMAIFLPNLYSSELSNDPDRAFMLLLTVLAGAVGSFVVGTISRHRLWLHMGLFFIIMLIIDVQAILTPLASQPTWFKALVILSLPIQVWSGGWAAKRIFRSAFGLAA